MTLISLLHAFHKTGASTDTDGQVKSNVVPAHKRIEAAVTAANGGNSLEKVSFADLFVAPKN